MASRQPPGSLLVSPPSNAKAAETDSGNSRTDSSCAKTPHDSVNASTSSTIVGEAAAQRSSDVSLAATQPSLGSDHGAAEFTSAPLTGSSQDPELALDRKLPAAEGTGRSVTNAWENRRTSFVPLPSLFDVTVVTPKPSTELNDGDSGAGSVVTSPAGTMSSAGIMTATNCEAAHINPKSSDDAAPARIEAPSAAGGSLAGPPAPAPEPPSTLKAQQRQSQSNERGPVKAQSGQLEDALENVAAAARCLLALVDVSVPFPLAQMSKNDDSKARRPEKTPRMPIRPSVDLDDTFFEMMNIVSADKALETICTMVD